VTIAKATLPTARALQQRLYNSAGPNVVQKTYTPSAGTNWAVVGCVMEAVYDPDSVDPATNEAAFVAAVEALAEVTNLTDPIIYGETPASLADAADECRLHVESRMSMKVGTGGDLRNRAENEHEMVKPPVNKQWLVLCLVVPAALDATKITALETALEGVQLDSQNVITTAEHLIDGTVRADATDVSLQLAARVRVDPTPA
jgi:hypothetical protein